MRVDQEVGIGGDAVEMHDFNDLEPPHVSPLDSPFLDMTSNWNLGLYVSGVPADSTSLTQETEHGASSARKSEKPLQTTMMNVGLLEQPSKPVLCAPGPRVHSLSIPFNLSFPMFSEQERASTFDYTSCLQADLNKAAAELGRATELHSSNLYQVGQVPMQSASCHYNDVAVITLDPNLLQAYVPPYCYQTMTTSSNSQAISQLSQELQKERQSLEEQMEKLSTQRNKMLAAELTDTLSENTCNTRSTVNSVSTNGSGHSSGSLRRRANKLGTCRVQGCETVLSAVSKYAKRHRICETHLKSLEVIWKGKKQRFCQKCTRFQDLSQFDSTRRSCRKGLTLQRNRRIDNKATEAGAESQSKKPRKTRLANPKASTVKVDDIMDESIAGNR